MRSSLAPTLFWAYWANVLYIMGMIGYLTIDTTSYVYPSFSNIISYIIYILLAIIFVIDAVLYTIDWFVYAVQLRKNKTEPIQYRSELFACIFQNLGSHFYLIGALLSLNKVQMITKIVMFNFIGIVSFLIESMLTLIGWAILLRRKPPSNPRNGCTIRNVYIWAHTLNIVANLIYLCAVLLTYYFYRTQQLIYPNTVLLLQIGGDSVYLFDAYLYHECWYRDREEFEANREQANFDESLHLENRDDNSKTNEKK